MNAITDLKKIILRAAFLIALVSAGCAAPQVRPLASAPEPPPAPVRAEQEQEPAEKKPAAKVEEPSPAPAAKVEEPAPAIDVKVDEPVPALDVKKEEPAPAVDVKVEEPAPAHDVKVVEPAPAPDVKKEEPAPTFDAKNKEPAPAPAAKVEEPVPATDMMKKEETISSPHTSVHAVVPAHPSKEAVRHHAEVPEPQVKAEIEPARSAPMPAPPAPAPAAQQQDKTSHARVKSLEEREHVVVPLPKGHSHRTLAERNDERLLYVFTGMYKSTVDQIMGGRYYYKREYWMDPDNHIIEVLFYLTREPKKGTPVTERHLTPVLIKDSKVSALGKYKLKKLRRIARRVSAPTAAAK